MHPRNIYKTPPDFAELARLYPEFAKISQLDFSGKVTVDFKNPETVRALTNCCLRKDFNLEVELPRDKLLPTIPLRLNYILWIEDLLEFFGMKEDVTGVDIGCGASCIYCLLAVRKNPSWTMFALEIDEENLKSARENIARNRLKNVILVSQENSSKIFQKLFEQNTQNVSFCICNPPFYSSKDEILGQNRTGKRKAPNSFHSGSSSELITDGGELGFVQKILAESLELQDKIEIYSTMLGCKKNLQKLINELEKQKIETFTTTEFVQGKTMRWAVAWSFKHDLKSFKDHNHQVSKKLKHVLTHTINQGDFEETVAKVLEIFNALKIAVTKVEEKPGHSHQWELAATQNTWSNQRQKRRAEQLNKKQSINDGNETKEDIKIGFKIRKANNSSQLQMMYLSGNMNKDCVNQIMQFIKNKFK